MGCSGPAKKHVVLLVEDEPACGQAVFNCLQQSGFEVNWVRSLAAMDLALHSVLPDIVVLSQFVTRTNTAPVLCDRLAEMPLMVIVLAATSSAFDQISILEMGADDVVDKTVTSVREIAARVRAVLRRAKRQANVAGQTQTATVGWVVDPARYEVRNTSGQVAALSPREFSAFRALHSLPRAFVPRRELHRAVFGEAVALDRRVDRLIWNVRRKLRGAGFDAGTIRSVHAKRGTGGGYLLREVVPVPWV